MLTAKDIKYLRLVRGLENAWMTLAGLEAEPYSWVNECLIARWKQIVQYREWKLKSFEEHNQKCSR
ncbi:hypothetical protein PSDA2_00009 [Salmonella phage PSDA-2]|uniref:Uncharacterized protein n=1 Tax=Salmonella phage vB_SenS_SE1 TaxID=2530161 RepID=A0A481W595_9CAUD|nr:hypothetical protein PF623_gp10 [Salmonella phage vB_SenS_SE1]EAS8631445.1 hypothetical protein [Salmonella enterica]EBK9093841.1 hypothetical protein [Salmonella enterica]QBJ03999.1 hypothetical protein [Salmonella phage vB_SenS_SE1]QVW27643.1 hypothetical protein PSDA2_00009 [Salmonella phage PSDA-2]